MNVHLGPKRSHSGPAMKRTRRLVKLLVIFSVVASCSDTYVAVRAAMLEFATSTVLMCKSALIVLVRSGGKAYL